MGVIGRRVSELPAAVGGQEDLDSPRYYRIARSGHQEWLCFAHHGRRDRTGGAGNAGGEQTPWQSQGHTYLSHHFLPGRLSLHQVVAIKAPGFGERRTSYLEDIAILTGQSLLSHQG